MKDRSMRKTKILAIVVPVIVFIIGFILIKNLMGNLHSESLYIYYIYLIAGLGIIHFLRSIYLKKEKRSFPLFFLYFLIMALCFISVFVLKAPFYITYALVIIATIFLILGVLDMFRKRH
jgi:FtsH-binding integral membrane protein